MLWLLYLEQPSEKGNSVLIIQALCGLNTCIVNAKKVEEKNQ